METFNKICEFVGIIGIGVIGASLAIFLVTGANYFVASKELAVQTLVYFRDVDKKVSISDILMDAANAGRQPNLPFDRDDNQ